MRRKKYHLDRYKTTSERKARATEIITSVTARLRSGWNVWVKVETTREHTPFSECLELYKAYLQRSAENNTMKAKTAYGYLSYLGIFCEWLQSRATPVKFCYQIDLYLLVDFLDHILLDRESSARTRNNYLGWLSTLCTWMVEKGYLKENPATKIKKIKEEPKKRNALSAGELASLQNYLHGTNKNFLLACLMEYYTFIRPIELAQIKLEHIHVAEQKVFVPASISKNRKDGMVGLNDAIIKLMVELRVFDKPSQCYLFGKDFKPSEKQADSRIFREYFTKVREALKWDDSKQFYSLKDSGIRDLANAEGIVVARDQARHSDISTTNKYLKGDSLTVHEQTKHFKGAFRATSTECPGGSAQSEPVASAPQKEVLAPLTPGEKEGTKQPDEKTPGATEEATCGKREASAVKKACAPAHTARSTSPSAGCQGGSAQSEPAMKATEGSTIPQKEQAAPIPSSPVNTISETEVQEAPANKARDFDSLIAGKVAGKKKRQRIKSNMIYSTSKK
ncbi:tyrosine-type recombinase/integrase [bacterium]|nr:tyrosine-type recombinase/integrase [bacterium]